MPRTLTCKRCGRQQPYRPMGANFILLCRACRAVLHLECEYGYGPVTPCHIYYRSKRWAPSPPTPPASTGWAPRCWLRRNSWTAKAWRRWNRPLNWQARWYDRRKGNGARRAPCPASVLKKIREPWMQNRPAGLQSPAGRFSVF